MPDRPDTHDSREILDRLSQIDVRQQGGLHGVRTVTRQPRLRRSVEAVRPWSLADVIIIALTLLAAGVVSSLIIGNRLTNLLPAVGVVWVRIILLLVFYAIELGVLALLAYRRKLPFSAAFRLRRLTEEERASSSPMQDASAAKRRPSPSSSPSPSLRPNSDDRPGMQPEASAALRSPRSFTIGRVVVAVVSASVLLRLAALAWTIWAAPLLHWSVPRSESMSYLFGSSTTGAVAALLIVAILGPFIEELAFRVIIQEWFVAHLPILVAVIITTAIFAASHVSLWAAPLYVLLGIVCSWLAWKSKTIWPAVIVHAIYNATAVIAAFYLILK
ncbi:MAG: CPBP family intramembrane metalloprotease [Coriobacteriia bacterium]|nr:CPBP family intramembrane metalloprotease [Coriobacteriia bacterium]